MGERVARVVGLLAAGALLAACGGAEGAPVPDRLVLGLVPAAEVGRLAADADRLAALLSAELGIPVGTAVTDSDAALVAAMRAGRADIGMFGPIALVRAADDECVVPVLQSVRGGAPTFHTQWMTGDPARFCSTPVVEVPDPEGRVFTYCNGTDTAVAGPVGEDALVRIADGEQVLFVDEGSVSGHHYPASQVQQLTGLHPLTGIDAQFVGEDLDSVLAVARGDVPVGVSSADARSLAVEEDPEAGERATVFAWSAEIPHDGVAVRGGLPVDVQRRIAAAMTAVVRTPEGAAAFGAVYSIEGLVPVDPAVLDLARRVAEDFDG